MAGREAGQTAEQTPVDERALIGGIVASWQTPAPTGKSKPGPGVIVCPDLSGDDALGWLPPTLTTALQGNRAACAVLRVNRAAPVAPADTPSNDAASVSGDGAGAAAAASPAEHVGRAAPGAADLIAALEAAPRVLTTPSVDPARITVVAVGLSAPAAAVASATWPAGVRLVLVAPVAVELSLRRAERKGEVLPGPEGFVRALAALAPFERLVSVRRPVLVLYPVGVPGDATDHAAPYLAALRAVNAPVRQAMVAFADSTGGDEGVRTATVDEIVDFGLEERP